MSVTTKKRHQAMSNLAMSQIERQFGKGAIMRLGSDATLSRCSGNPNRLALP